jgi:hypothetical protein
MFDYWVVMNQGLLQPPSSPRLAQTAARRARQLAARPGTDRVGAVVLGALLVGALLVGCSPFASKGTMPPPGPNGQVDPSSAPDFLAVAGRVGGIAGYGHQEDILTPGDAPFPVYGENLTTVIGQMVPGRGFVPAGVDPATVPTFAVEAGPSGQEQPDGDKAVLYVRNDSLHEVHDAVLAGGQITDSGGYSGQNMGVGCYSMPVGSRLVLLDRSASQPGASVVHDIYTSDNELDAPSMWVTIGEDGSVQQGTGVPAWWGAPQAC